MEVTIGDQTKMFLIMVIAGFIIGFLYDWIRIFRRGIKHLNLFVHIEDLLYWVGATIAMFILIMYKNNGEVRFYLLLGTFLGMIIYFMTLSIGIMFIANKVIIFIEKCLKIFIKSVSIPINFMVQLFKRPCKALLQFINKSFILLATKIKVGVKKILSLKSRRKTCEEDKG